MSRAKRKCIHKRTGKVYDSKVRYSGFLIYTTRDNCSKVEEILKEMREEVEKIHLYLDKLSEKHKLKSIKITHDRTTMKIEWDEINTIKRERI